MSRVKNYLLLHLIILFYSVASICSKYASGKKFFSLSFCLLYCTLILILGIYAILWQQILKKIPLNIAFANKAVTMIWGMIWGTVLFDENITWKKVLGAFIVMIGVVVIIVGEKNDKLEENK